jgi:hypothetical protein
MEQSISRKSTVERFDIGLIMGALANGFSEESITGIFGDTWKEIELDKNKPLASALEMHRREGEVGYSTHGYEVIKSLLETRRHVDRILFFTDCQMYGHDFASFESQYWSDQDDCCPETGRNIGEFIREYREQINPLLKLYFFDLAGYGSCVVPEKDQQTMIVGGWSEKLFELIPSFENGQLSVFLESIRNKYNEWKQKKQQPKQEKLAA